MSHCSSSRISSVSLVTLLLCVVIIGKLPIISYALAAESTNTCLDQRLSLSGGAVVVDSQLSAAQEEITQFLSSSPNGDEHEGEFYIQGWRWHTLSLAREARRLSKVAQQKTQQCSCVIMDQDFAPIRTATDHIVSFNMKGLHKIEKDLFFPWARQKVQSLNESPPGLDRAFNALMDQLERDRKTIASLGNELEKVSSVVTESTDGQARLDALKEMAVKSGAIADCAKLMLDLEDKLLVPTIAKVVPASEQKSFNDKVIRNLGIFDSRLHLVGMYEAVWELNDENERDLFQKSIPSIPRMMIPRWKRLLYEPRVAVLNAEAVVE